MREVDKIKNRLRDFINKDKVAIYQNFFKTGHGQYGEGDIFWGINVPNQQKVVKEFKDVSIDTILELLKSKVHEHRLTSIMMFTNKFLISDKKTQEKIYKLYLKNAKYVNNWDLVDSSAHIIIGGYLYENKLNRNILEKLAKSKNLWEKRISIIATYYFIKNKEYKDTFKIAEILINDKHDLIHKACGWMLREVGKRINQEIEEEFLKKYYKKMPRTMLRYAIERFEESKRQYYLKS